MRSTLHFSSNDCIFCGEEKGSGLGAMMNDAILAKHAVNQSDNYLSYIDVIMKLEQPCNTFEVWSAYQFLEYQVLDEKEEFLKREYLITQYGGKINMLTDYYKFHSNIPRVIEPNIQKILGKYYDKKKQYDYKKIKKILKQQQGLSITSMQESQSSMPDSIEEKKSRYSTLLDGLQDSKLHQENFMSDSKMLKEMCKVIEKALPASKNDTNFQIKGSFNNHNHDRIFEQYLKQEQQRLKFKMRKRKRDQEPRIPKKINLEAFFNQRQNKQMQKQKQRDKNTREPRQLKKKEKKNKFIYNTNIKIQIKNAMFYPQDQQPPFSIGKIEYESGNKMNSGFTKKSLFNQVNYLNHESNKKLVTDIYKSTQQDLKRRLQNNYNKQRLSTKESFNRSQCKSRKKSLTKETLSNQLKKGMPGSSSARKLVYSNNQVTNTKSTNKLPPKSISASNLKKRSFSSNGAVVTSTGSFTKKNEKLFEKRPVESISKYGSSDMKPTRNNLYDQMDRQKRAVSIKEILNRRLTIKRE